MQFGFDDGVSMTSLKGPMGHFRSSLASVLISHSSYLWIDHQPCTTHNYAIQFSRENRVFVQRSGLKEISFIDHTNGNRPLPPPPHPPLCPHHPPPFVFIVSDLCRQAMIASVRLCVSKIEDIVTEQFPVSTVTRESNSEVRPAVDLSFIFAIAGRQCMFL